MKKSIALCVLLIGFSISFIIQIFNVVAYELEISDLKRQIQDMDSVINILDHDCNELSAEKEVL